MEQFSFLIIAGTTIVIIIASCLFAIIFNFKNTVEKDSKNLSYLRKRQPGEEMREREQRIMGDLKRGKIKCHLLPNSAVPYNAEIWVTSMKTFMKSPVFKQLMDLKGNDVP